MNDVLRYRLAAAALGTAVAMSGCSGGGGSSAAPATATSKSGSVGSAKVVLTIKIPRRQAKSSAKIRTPRYVSTFTTGLYVRAATVGAIDAASWQDFNVGSGSTLCASGTTAETTGFYTCNVQIAAPAVTGTQDEFQVEATDVAPTAATTLPTATLPGNLLSGGDTTATVTAGAANPISIELSGVIGKLSTDKTAYTVWAAPGSTATIPVAITADDLDGGLIFGYTPYTNPISIADTLGTASPFTYPASSALAPPVDPGTVAAPITYTASATLVTQAAVTATVSTTIPDYIALATPPTAAFTIAPLIVSTAVNPAPIAAVPTISATGAPTNTNQTALQVNEAGATSSFTFTVSPAALVTVTPTAITPAGTQAFLVTAGGAAGTGTLTITDATGTAAVLTVTVSP